MGGLFVGWFGFVLILLLWWFFVNFREAGGFFAGGILGSVCACVHVLDSVGFLCVFRCAGVLVSGVSPCAFLWVFLC